MEYCLCYFNSDGAMMGETPFEAVDNAAAIVVACGLAKSATDRRTELWNEDRLVMRRSFPEPASTDERSDKPS